MYGIRGTYNRNVGPEEEIKERLKNDGKLWTDIFTGYCVEKKSIEDISSETSIPVVWVRFIIGKMISNANKRFIDEVIK